MNNGKWDVRIRRASELAAAHPFAAEGLRFYERLARFQKSLYSEIEPAAADQRCRGLLALSGRNSTHFCFFRDSLPSFR